ncbi:Scm-like with four MBT domains protein 2 [Larimichthys crocea]|uniref:Uncharacterized protein n=1 Tax=Larimichthys crocea TaxID=215358 RepID=A0ACD3Q6D1_LARCR|nr:Scm-like with four MBT domains protein 2 [Larimichthys crocea]
MQSCKQEQPLALTAVKSHYPTNGKEEEVNTDADNMEEEAEFNWEEYMEETGANGAPHTTFKHVEISLQSSFQPGMKLEVANKSNPDTYWVATIITTCGQLLLLRFSGYGEDRKADFWCDVMTAELHPVGWCSLNNKTLMPPEAIKEKYSDWTEFLIHDLTGSRTAPANLLEGPLRGKNTVDLIVEGSVLELQDVSDPLLYWPVHVLHNVGGRLRLRYAGLSDDNQADDTWLFYLDVRLRPLGWALENRLTLEPPTEVEHICLNVLTLLCQDHVDLPKHSFKTGMKLEMVSPWEQLRICPVSVTKVYDEIYFQVMLDDLSVEAKPRFVVCHASSPGILPVQWCLKNGVGLERPPGYDGQDFDWADYLKHSGTEAAPDACFPDVRAGKVLIFKDTLIVVVYLKKKFFTQLCWELGEVNTRVRNSWGSSCPLVFIGNRKVNNAQVHQTNQFVLIPVMFSLTLGLRNRSHLFDCNEPILPRRLCTPKPRWTSITKTNLMVCCCIFTAEEASGMRTNWLGLTNETRSIHCIITTRFQTYHRTSRHRSRSIFNLTLPAQKHATNLQNQCQRALSKVENQGVVKPLSECIVDVESMDIFPVGWLAPSQPVETTPVNHCQPVAVDPGSANGRYCCSKIFVNHRCFSGPYLNKGRIAELPQAVGPGKCTLVLKELLSMLINAAYKPGRVLKELQELEDQSWDCQEETLKAKYKGKTYRSTIRIVRIADQIPDFCRKVCVKLQCCSNLFSPVLVTDKCPENCSVQTKTKYSESL